MMRATTWGLGGAAVLGGMVASSLLAGPERDLRERLAAFAAAHAPPPAEPVGRPPLVGDGHPCDARVCYEAADALLGRGDRWRSFLEADAAVAALEPVVAMVRLGASARRVTLAPVLHRALATLHRLRTVMQSMRRRAVVRGEWGEAIELWAAETSLALDLAPEQPHGLDVDAAWPPEQLSRMPPAAVAKLDTVLARLDDRLPADRDVAAALAGAVRRLLAGEHRPSLRLRDCVTAWSTGFDPQRRELEAAAVLVDAIPLLAARDTRWRERSQRWERVLGVVPRSESSHAGYALHWYRNTEHATQTVRTEVRLLRLALAFTFGEPLPELADPFGTASFQVRVDGDVARFRSAAAPRVLQREAVRRTAR